MGNKDDSARDGGAENGLSAHAPLKELQGLLASSMRQRAPSSPPVSPRLTTHHFKHSPAHDEHREVAATIILSPKEAYDHIVAAGVAKTKLTLAKQVTLGVLAGFYISFSFMLCMTVGGQIPAIQHEHPGLYNLILGSVGFPLGLTIIMVVGADLFTSSCMYMFVAWIEGRVAFYYVIKNWIITWWSNLAGCLIMAKLVYWAGFFAPPKNEFAIYLAHKKTSATFGATVVKGILCNWLVNLAVWMANGAHDMTGKAMAVYLPVSAFVTLGTEHVIANQFQLSIAKMLGSGIPLRTMICSNWIPATIGNIIGGAFFVGTLYAGTYGTLYDRMWFRFVQVYIWAVPCPIRERNTTICKAVHERMYAWVDWDAITAPPGPLPAAAAPNAVVPRISGPGASGLTRGLSTKLAETPRRMATAVVAATRNPPMTPFERQRTEDGLGSDVV